MVWLVVSYVWGVVYIGILLNLVYIYASYFHGTLNITDKTSGLLYRYVCLNYLVLAMQYHVIIVIYIHVLIRCCV